MKRIRTLLGLFIICFIFCSFCGCSPEVESNNEPDTKNNALSVEYVPYSEISASYSMEHAIDDGCVVKAADFNSYFTDPGAEKIYNEEILAEFIELTEDGQEALLRVVTIFSSSNNQLYTTGPSYDVADIEFRDGMYRFYYQYYDSTGETVTVDKKYKYLIKLDENALPLQSNGGIAYVLANDENIEYSDIIGDKPNMENSFAQSGQNAIVILQINNGF